MKKYTHIIIALMFIPMAAYAGGAMLMQIGGGVAAGGGGPTKVAYDNFTDTDSTDLAAHTADSTHTWTKQGGPNLTITSNHAHAATSDESGFYYMSYTPSDADYTVKATFYSILSGGVTPMIYGRCSTSANTGYAVRYGAGTWYLYSIVAGSESSIGTYAGDAPTSERVVELIMSGTSISVKIDGTQRIGVTDSSITASGRPGAGSYYADTGSDRYIDTYEVWD